MDDDDIVRLGGEWQRSGCGCNDLFKVSEINIIN